MNVRTVVLNHFPFMIHYTIDENDKAIIIAAILHTSRDPRIWKNR
jgi:plasmid stabilization system protein ParE